MTLLLSILHDGRWYEQNYMWAIGTAVCQWNAEICGVIHGNSLIAHVLGQDAKYALSD